jgi:hypothetical protein
MAQLPAVLLPFIKALAPNLEGRPEAIMMTISRDWFAEWFGNGHQRSLQHCRHELERRDIRIS